MSLFVVEFFISSLLRRSAPWGEVVIKELPPLAPPLLRRGGYVIILDMKLVVGLGNPGEEYEETRHNTGWIMLDFILGNKDWKPANGTKLLYYKDSIGGKPTEYIKPTTFMNNSGVAVSFVKEKHNLKLTDIVVIYDDVDLPIGKMKISYDRSSGGHNGLGSIIKALKSEEFIRIRIGISRNVLSRCSCRIMVAPSMFGILISVITSITFSRRKISNASFPFAASKRGYSN